MVATESAFDRQINDVVRFCTNEREYSVFGIDPTFDLGEFSVTVCTYRHLLLTSRRSKQPPVMIGPIMIHQHKRKQDYHFLAASLVGLHSGLQKIQAIGTDGEMAIADGVQVQFNESKHVLCFLHVKNNLKRKLQEMGITSEAIRQFLDDVFGHQEGSCKVAGLVDCDTPEEFDGLLEGLQFSWNEREIACTKAKEPKFFNWFSLYHASIC